MIPHLALSFDSPAALDVALVGGKATNLARLTQGKLPVPPGFVLTADAYATFARSADNLFAAVRFACDDPETLERQCAELQAALQPLAVPEEVCAALRAELARFPTGTAFSVRSSSTTEDLGGAAFAGQHDTYLNRVGFADIVDRVRDCWLSLWSARAVAYRHAAGFDVFATSMAVVVQRMVFSEIAGVGFSLDPVSGNLRQQVFDANYGLGESVVGGETGVDHFVVDKASGALLHQQVAEKSLRIEAMPEGGTREVALDAAAAHAPCLDAGQLAELSALLRQVESLYGYPQDIEWGFAAGRLWLLQARPVTRIPPRWTRDESAERFPSVMTPLAWALVEEGFHKSLNYSFALMGMPPYRDKWFAMFDHYIYGNQNAVEIYADGAAAHLRIGSLPELLAAIPTLRQQYAWVLDLPVTWSRDLDRYLMGLGELLAEPLAGKSTLDLWGYVLRVKDLGADYFLPNIAISITQRTLYRILLAILEIAVGKERAPAMFDTLLAHCETKTGAINRELYRLARRIAELPALAQRLADEDARTFLTGGGFAPWPELDASFARFLRDHGHREVEFDPYHPTWVEAPWLVIDNLKAMMGGNRPDPAEKEREQRIAMRQAEEALIAGLPGEIRFFVSEIVRLARAYTTLDDVEHYQTTRLTLPFRRGLRALGERLVGMGVLNEPMDVFFAQYAMLDATVRADRPAAWAELKAAVAEEKAAYLAHSRQTPAHAWGLQDEAAPADAAALTGLAGSPGIAAGPVYRVFDAGDFAGFPPGAVLVARTTNPAWTPLFYKAAAVVTESGGPLSHGAVTAREIGLPAVMSVRGVMTRLGNGQRVRVDGGTGRVTVLADT